MPADTKRKRGGELEEKEDSHQESPQTSTGIKQDNNGGHLSELNILHSDDDIVVLDKPSGLRTVPGKAVGPEAKTRAHVRF